MTLLLCNSVFQWSWFDSHLYERADGARILWGGFFHSSRFFHSSE